MKAKSKTKRTVKKVTPKKRKASAKPTAKKVAAPKKQTLLQVWLDVRLHEWAKTQAKKEFRSTSDFVRKLLLEKQARTK